MKRIDYLDLEFNQIGDVSASFIAQMNGITKLYPQGNQIGDTGASHIAQMQGITHLRPQQQ